MLPASKLLAHRPAEQLDRYQGEPGAPAAPGSVVGASGSGVAGPSNALRDRVGGDAVRDGSIPKPKGSAGGGKKGFHLQEEMGLADSEDGDRMYNMILVCVLSFI